MGRDLEIIIVDLPHSNASQTLLALDRDYELFDCILKAQTIEKLEPLKLYVPELESAVEIYTDSYGEPIKYTTIDRLLTELAKAVFILSGRNLGIFRYLQSCEHNTQVALYWN
jgi:hypothetical protein